MITFQDIQDLAHELWLKDGNLIDIEAIAYGRNLENNSYSRKNRKVMPDKKFKKAQEMQKAGYTLDNIIEKLELNMDKAKLSYWLRLGTNNSKYRVIRPKKEDLELIKSMYLEGYYTREIACELSKSQNYVLGCLSRIRTPELKEERRNNIKTDRVEKKKQIKKLLKKGFKCQVIAEKLEMNKVTCAKYIREVRECNYE